MKKTVSVLVALFAAYSAIAQDLTILHVNDTHSQIEPQRKDVPGPGEGGVIEQAAYISEVRHEMGKKNVLLLHAGDFSQGSSYFTELDGQIEIDVINAMGFDVITIGNHEFDNGTEALAQRLRQLDCHVVCANYDFSSTPLDKLIDPYVIVRKAGKKIGVIGLLTDLSSVVDASKNAGLVYQDPVAVTQKYATYLKDEKKCDLVICLTHLGDERGKNPHTAIDQDVVAGTTDVDIVVGGHAHTRLDDLLLWKNKAGEDVIYITDGKWGLEVGRLDIEF